ncbi:MAG: leucine-rich repeat domain-containing protein [Bacteroidaceae bacterium]|nr:leucine-rich repeat domain-containing protein [Bacteroidaceae bacterium]
MKTRLLLTLTALLLALSSWANGIEINGIHYLLDRESRTASVTYPGTNADATSTYADTIVIPSEITYRDTLYSVTAIGESSFYNCSTLKVIAFPSTIKRIEKNAFCGCYNLKEIDLPPLLEFIGERAFRGCSGLITLVLPNSVKTINPQAFYFCTGLKGQLIIPDGVTTIGHAAFSTCHNLNSIVLPSNLKVIESQAFEDCRNLSMKVILPETVVSIGDYAFSHCQHITEVYIPNSVKNLGKYAFFDCQHLIRTNISNALIKLEEGVFGGCEELNNVVIPNSVKTIEKAAFQGCSKLSNISLGDSLVYIKGFVFSDNYSLVSITFPNTLKGIYENVFQNCKNLKEIKLPKSLEYIGGYAFSGCTSLTGDFVIPESVQSFGHYAFNYCTGLNTIIIPPSITSLPEGAFRMCSGMKYINLPETLKNINQAAFQGCSSLKQIKIPQSVGFFALYAFDGCSSLESINIPVSIKSIGSKVFIGCNSLKDIYVESTIPRQYNAQTDIFETSIYNTCTLHIPFLAFRDQYESTAPWSNFKNIIKDKDFETFKENIAIAFNETNGFTEETKLDGNIIDNIYYNIGVEDGFYDVTDNSITITTPTNDDFVESYENKDFISEDFQNNFTGIVLKLPASNGTIQITAETFGNTILKVKIGNQKPIDMQAKEKQQLSIPYDVSSDSYVFIYACQPSINTRSLHDVQIKTDNALKLYSIEWNPDNITDIDNLYDKKLEIPSYYNLQGQRIAEPQKGIVIVRYSNGTSRKMYVR